MVPQPCTYPRQRTILLVEDEPFVREATRGILEKSGFEVLPAENAAVAMQLYASFLRPIDLVMTDMILPGRTGRQLAEDLRNHEKSNNSNNKDLRVLITSGYYNPEYASETPESQSYFLAKPYSRRSLIEKIEQILAPVPLSRTAGQAV
jgi:two-component system cell cycle sensor histidine kinase/response regulator CckA